MICTEDMYALEQQETQIIANVVNFCPNCGMDLRDITHRTDVLDDRRTF